MTMEPDPRENVERRPIGLASSISTSSSNNYVGSLLSTVNNKSAYAPGTQVQLIFDPVAEALIAHDRLSGKTVVVHAFSESDSKGSIPYGKFELLGHERKPTWLRIDAVDGVYRDDVTSFEGQGKFIALRLHYGRVSRGCITVTDDEKYHKEILPMIKGAIPERIADRPVSYRKFGDDFDLNDFGLAELLTEPSQNYKYGELEVRSLNYCPAFKTTDSVRQIPNRDLKAVSVSDRPNGLMLNNDEISQDKSDKLNGSYENVSPPSGINVLP